MKDLRTDARKNRGHILEAARIVFTEHGITAPLDLVIEQAGIGRATLYRNFPDRDMLVAALLSDAIDEIEGKLKEVGDDPAGLFIVLAEKADRITRRTPLMDYWRVVDRELSEFKAAEARLSAIYTKLIENAADAGMCRRDLTPDDVFTISAMLGASLRGRNLEERSRIAHRALAIIFDGLRPARGE